MKINENEKKVLEVLAEHWSDEERCGYTKSIAEYADIDFKLARRAVRSLVRKGLALYVRGLMDEEGFVAGSGYCCSQAGVALWESFSPLPNKGGESKEE